MSRRFDVYAAGLVDGEGCITAKSTKSGTGMGIRVLIGMSTKASAVLKRMQSNYGGTLITQRPDNPAHSEIITWTVNGSAAAKFLRAIEPHLILKAEQAQVALRIEEIRTSQERIGGRDHYRWTAESMGRCEILHRRLNELNERGREALPTEGTPFARLVAGQWVTDQADLFSDLGWEPYSETWPRSGYMRSGSAYELPMSGPAIAASGSSSSSLLPTPNAANATQRTRSAEALARNDHQANLTDLPRLLPTPRRSDGDGGPNPLSRAERMDDVETRIIRSCGTDWGDYEPAIRRAEAACGRPAPSPTEPNRNGNPRLSSRFAEWMMLLPDGHVTGIGLSRNEELKALGNGVVPAQAYAALCQLVPIAEAVA